jgi:hypothetical protein
MVSSFDTRTDKSRGAQANAGPGLFIAPAISGPELDKRFLGPGLGMCIQKIAQHSFFAVEGKVKLSNKTLWVGHYCFS